MPDVRLGLSVNRQQFWLLVAVNAFVGAMAGLERTVVPLLARQEFGIASGAAVLAFVGTFGLVKAVTNWLAGAAADRLGRRRVLILGWLAGVPVPLIIMAAPTWSWVVFANVLLGINQGLAWSTTVIMKVDLVGPERRGFAMGLNEFAGYVAVGLTAFATGVLAARFGLRPEPFYLGVAFAALGLGLSVFFVRDTLGHMQLEAGSQSAGSNAVPATGSYGTFARMTWRDRTLSSCSQAGLVNNLNDGVAWGLFPLLFASAGLGVERIGVLAAVYPLSWGMLQLWTGAGSDRWGRKPLIVGGMLLQGVALGLIALSHRFGPWFAALILLGAGTAMVYPTLLAAVADRAAPEWRGSAIGAYRFWRDMGYVVGALGAGALAHTAGTRIAIAATAAVTAASGLFAALRMDETMRRAT